MKKVIFLMLLSASVQAREAFFCYPFGDEQFALAVFVGTDEKKPLVQHRGDSSWADMKITGKGKATTWRFDYGGENRTDYMVSVSLASGGKNLYYAHWYDFSESQEERNSDFEFLCAKAKLPKDF